MSFSSCDLNEAVCEALERAGLARFDLADDDESSGNVRAANAVQRAIDDRAALLAALQPFVDPASRPMWATPAQWEELPTIKAAIAAIAQVEGRAPPQSRTVWLVTHSDRYGVSNWAFSSEAKADAYSGAFIRKRWAENHSDEPIPDDAAEMFQQWAELEPDETIEQDQVSIDEEA